MEMGYDIQGNLAERINPVGAKTKYNYEDGLLAKIINPTGAILY
ncbi:MAG: RHS repeat protein [Bacteroidetes bacterium]|nr:RHS repeat protein [Bacteroidota bacterium]